MASIVLMFPPQWSPFQPPLSLPSLKAWVEGQSSHRVTLLDSNVELYHYLFSEQLLSHPLIRNSPLCDLIENCYRLLVPEYLRGLLGENGRVPTLPEYYSGISGLASLLRFLSDKVFPFDVSFSEFRLPGNEFEASFLDEMVASPPDLLADFVDAHLARHAEAIAGADAIGLSCIGQQQVFFTLLFARTLKERTGKPVLVGGTVLARMLFRNCLPEHWFGKYFDALCLHEGERPLLDALNLLDRGEFGEREVEGLATTVHGWGSGRQPVPLDTASIPPPDFSGLPLEQYLSPELILPILGSRGCYWGKCEFCHHGMVYGGKYSASGVEKLEHDIGLLSRRFGAKTFSFNDEAIPPKLFRAMGEGFAPHAESGLAFTALLKFEAYFQRSDWERAAAVGFRSLYFGLESASERVLGLQRKLTPIEDIVRNLREATEAGIWAHCFAFYGFPGETASEADLTHDFLLGNTDIIGSVGVGAFALEHGSPMFSHPERFGVTVTGPRSGDLDVYYSYEVQTGIDAAEAAAMAKKTRAEAYAVPSFVAGFWNPRELLPVVLARYGRAGLLEFSRKLIKNGFTLVDAPVGAQIRTFRDRRGVGFAVLSANLRLFEVSDVLFDLLRAREVQELPVESLMSYLPYINEAPVQVHHTTLPS